MESWRKVFREGLAPLLSRRALEVLRDAFECDSPELCQGATTQAKAEPGAWFSGVAPCAACLIGYVGWRGEGLETIGEVETFFSEMCFQMDQRLGEPSACRYLLGFFDESPWPVVKAELLPEIRIALEGKA